MQKVPHEQTIKHLNQDVVSVTGFPFCLKTPVGLNSTAL